MRTPLVAGNWKMHLDGARAERLVRGLLDVVTDGPPQVAVFPSFPLLERVARWAEGSRLIVGAQNCHWEREGAFTGEVSAQQVADAGGTMVLLGHSERRRDFGEDEAMLRRKIERALEAGLAPVLCVGERLEEREAGRTLEVVGGQLEGALEGFGTRDLEGRLVVAYEPVWAIGTGRNATPEQAAEVHAFVRGVLGRKFGAGFAEQTRVLYGGSVKPDNARTLFAEEAIDGGLVGGASLVLEDFVEIVKAAR